MILRYERTVKRTIMRNKIRPANKSRQVGTSFTGGRSLCYILVMDVRKMRYILRDRLSRVYERNKPVNDCAIMHTRRRNLRELVMIERHACCLGIDDHNIFVKCSVVRCCGIVFQTRIALYNVARRTVRRIFFHSRDIYHFVFHAVQPIMNRNSCTTKRLLSRRKHVHDSLLRHVCAL